MATLEEELLATLETAGTVVSIVCPGCGALVDLGETLAKLILKRQTEAEQVKNAEQAILDADASAVLAAKK